MLDWLKAQELFVEKTSTVAYLGGFLRFLETTQVHQFSITQCAVASFPGHTQGFFPKCRLSKCQLQEPRMSKKNVN